MADWATISSLGTAGGTLVLAVATFASVRSSNRSARIAEQALREQRRPVLAHSRLDDPVQKIAFGDGHWVRVGGSGAAFEEAGGVIYLALSVRNVASGIGVLQAWHVEVGQTRTLGGDHAPLDVFRPHSRDLLIPGGDIGVWQGAIRDPEDPARAALSRALAERREVAVELLYADQTGEQRTVSRFGLLPVGDDAWLAGVGRHWLLDADDAR